MNKPCCFYQTKGSGVPQKSCDDSLALGLRGRLGPRPGRLREGEPPQATGDGGHERQQASNMIL